MGRGGAGPEGAGGNGVSDPADSPQPAIQEAAAAGPKKDPVVLDLFLKFGPFVQARDKYLVRNPILAAAFGSPDSAPAANLIANLPSTVDPRGIGTFGFAGVFFLVLGMLLRDVNGIPRRLADLTLLGGVLLEIIFIGTVLYAGGLGIAPARYLFLVAGPIQSVIVGPIVYIWLGMLLRKNMA